MARTGLNHKFQTDPGHLGLEISMHASKIRLFFINNKYKHVFLGLISFKMADESMCMCDATAAGLREIKIDISCSFKKL